MSQYYYSTGGNENMYTEIVSGYLCLLRFGPAHAEYGLKAVSPGPICSTVQNLLLE